MRVINQEHVTAPIDAIRPHPRNPRQGDVGAIHESIENNGFYGSVIAQKSTGYILAGNHRWQAARQAGATEIPVTWVDVDDDHALRILLADNRTNDLANYDNEALAEILKDLHAETGTLIGTGYDGDDLDELLEDLGRDTDHRPAPEPQVDRAEELREKWGTAPGQLWVIGRHRLLCGDSTNPEHVRRLVAGASVDLTFTDPPYNVGIEYGDGVNDKMTPDAYATFTRRWFDLCPSDGVVLTPGIVNLPLWYEHVGAPKWLCAWRKTNQNSNSGIGGFNTWEPILVYGKLPKRVGHDSWDIPIGLQSDTHHPVPKFLEAWQAILTDFTNTGHIIYEPFTGSGTTMVAAERTGRACFGMELEPKYVAVTLERLADLGLTPQLAD